MRGVYIQIKGMQNAFVYCMKEPVPKMEEFFSWIVLFLSLFLSTILVLFLKRRRARSCRNGSRVPSGSSGWPFFIGETPKFISCAHSDDPSRFVQERRHRYGDVFKSHLFGSPTIVSSDAEVNRYVLQCDPQTFVTFLPKSVRDLLGKSSILLVNGTLQRRLHGLIGTYVKSPQLKAITTKYLQKYIKESMATWKEDQLVHIQHHTKRIAFQVLAKVLIGLDLGEEMEYLRQLYEQFIAGFSSLPIKFPGSKFYKSLQAKKEMVKLLNKIMEGKRNSIKANSRVEEDAADILINGADDELTDEVISSNLVDLMVPGEANIPVLVSLIIKFLSSSPKALQEFTNENIDMKKRKDQLGEPMQWTDYASLPFTQCVIAETLRVGNIVSGVMREAKKDVEIKGHLIPKGWSVMTDFRSLHLDPSQYEDPHQFNPWRWQDKEALNGTNYTPFGFGQRMCPGSDLSKLEASIFLHHLVTQFSWVAEDDKIITFPTVSLKKGMPVRVKRRADG